MHKDRYGIEPICGVLPTRDVLRTPRAAQRPPTPLEAGEARCAAEIERVWGENFKVYGARKVWLQLNTLPVARTVARLMKAGDGAVTTLPDEATERPQDAVNRHFVRTPYGWRT